MVRIAEVTSGDIESSSQIEYFTYLSPIPLSGNPEFKSINNGDGAIGKLFSGSIEDDNKQYQHDVEENLSAIITNEDNKNVSSKLNWIIIAILNIIFNIAASGSLLIIVILFKTRKGLLQILKGTTIGALYGLEATIYFFTLYHKSVFIILEIISSWMNIPYFGIRSSMKNPSVEKLHDFNPQLNFATLHGIFWSDAEVLPDKKFKDIIVFENSEDTEFNENNSIRNKEKPQESSAFVTFLDKAFKNILYRSEKSDLEKNNEAVKSDFNDQNTKWVSNNQYQGSQSIESSSKENNKSKDENIKETNEIKKKLGNSFQLNDKSNQVTPSEKIGYYLRRKRYVVNSNHISNEKVDLKPTENSDVATNLNMKGQQQKRRHRLWGNESTNNLKKQIHGLTKTYDIEINDNNQRKLEKKFNQQNADLSGSLAISLDDENNNTVLKREEKSAFVPINSSSVINLENYEADG